MECGDLVYQKKDPRKNVGTLIAMEGKQGTVRWHPTYHTTMLLSQLSVDVPPGVNEGEHIPV